MNEQENKAATDAEALERLRDRTDELELIISSLTIFALFSLPGWLFGNFADIYSHLSTSLVIAATVGGAVITGTSYGLAACFVVHLMARAYWVGLIGLRTVFPDGIDWDKTPGLGPLSRKYYRDTLPGLDAVIQKTDKVASSLFAVISMLTLSMLWFGTILVGTLVFSGWLGSRFGLTNAGMGIGSFVLIVVFMGIPILVWLLDKVLASRIRGMRESVFLARFIRVMRLIEGIAYPRRLVLPVQLTLQSNTRPFIFFFALMIGIVAIVLIGNTRANASRNFTISDEFVYLQNPIALEGLLSTYYEDMPAPLDRYRGWPRINSLYQGSSYVALFLPYMPIRDNIVLEDQCGDPSDQQESLACLRNLWSVSIEGRPVPMADFLPAERADLNMRGLMGLVPLDGLEPGMRQITVVWNAGATDESTPLDDRYSQSTRRYLIPIAFAPNYEQQLESQ
jgi:MFS family permease